jgi:hypothetical protein
MNNDPKFINPALAERLQKLAEMAREIGADQILTLRGQTFIAGVRPHGDPIFGPMPQVMAFGGRLLLVIHFPLDDGGEGVKEL